MKKANRFERSACAQYSTVYAALNDAGTVEPDAAA
jgi:hypothetical protein